MTSAHDDPRLTAYALGDLDDAERAEVERELAAAPELQAEVEAIRRLAGQLGAALRAEPAPAFREVVVTAAEPRRSLSRPSRGRRWIAVLTVAASVLVVVGILAWPRGDVRVSRTTQLEGMPRFETTPKLEGGQDRETLSDLAGASPRTEGRVPAESSSPTDPRGAVAQQTPATPDPAASSPVPTLNKPVQPVDPVQPIGVLSEEDKQSAPLGTQQPSDWSTETKDVYSIPTVTGGGGAMGKGGGSALSPGFRPWPTVGEPGPESTSDRPFQVFGEPATNGVGGGAEGKGGGGPHTQWKTIGESITSGDVGDTRSSTVGRTSPDLFSTDLDAPFQEGSFGLAVPRFGKDAELDQAIAATKQKLDESNRQYSELSKQLGALDPESAGIRSKLLFDALAGRSRQELTASAELMKAEEELKRAEADPERSPEDIAKKQAEVDRRKEDVRVASAEAEYLRAEISTISDRSAELERQRDEVDALKVALGKLLEESRRRDDARNLGAEAYDTIVENPFRRVSDDPLSTFSIDVDTASYSNVRRFLDQRTLPPRSAVRIEELVNYFRYDYPQPEGEEPFAVHLEVAGCPWAPEHRLVRVALKGREVDPQRRPPSNLVFLVDVSGSMRPDNKLPLVKQGLRMLTERLGEDDRVAIVTYAGNSGVALPSTGGEQKSTILQAIDALEAGGSTNGASGIELAYALAVGHFIKNGTNRVILCTDGDFNVGITDRDELTRLIEHKAASGVFLSVLGFGMGNLKDGTLETLADKGNGVYAYLDTEREARKVLVEELSGTLVTIAKDVKLQLEFNPSRVAAYRLLGYENRVLAHQDFNDDRKDAGDIGAGHTVTAFYEIVPAGGDGPVPGVDPLKYQAPAEKAAPATDAAEQPASDELLTVKLRYKQPDGVTSKLLEAPLKDAGHALSAASNEFRFAAAVVEFGLLLRDSAYRGGASLANVQAQAESSLGEDPEGYRSEFLRLVAQARAVGN